MQQEINKMIERAATSESDEDDDLSDDIVEGRIQCNSDMLRHCVMNVYNNSTQWSILYW